MIAFFRTRTGRRELGRSPKGHDEVTFLEMPSPASGSGAAEASWAAFASICHRAHHTPLRRPRMPAAAILALAGVIGHRKANAR